MKGARTLLVLGGEPPAKNLLALHYEEADHCIAVDSGLLAFRNADLEPEVLIGDLDSCDLDVDRETAFPSLRVVCLDDQETTDFEKALLWVSEETETNELIILGGTGKRSDHFLSNLLIACVYDETSSLTFDGEGEWIKRVTSATPLRLVGRAGVTLSLIPLTPCSSVETSGLKWNLSRETLAVGHKFSQSNEVLSDLVTVSCEKGILFAILQK